MYFSYKSYNCIVKIVGETEISTCGGGLLKSYIRDYLPILNWLPSYSKTQLSGDINAGMVTAIMLVPQSMAYALLAGLPPEMGLYASIIPLMLYAVFGSSRVLAVGPVALVSLMVASTLNGLDGVQETAQLMNAAELLALMVGVISIVMGLLRIGFIASLVSHHVISGFTSAAALIIFFSQLKHLLGVGIPRTHNIFAILGRAYEKLPALNLASFAIGVGSVVILLFFKNHLEKLLSRIGLNRSLGETMTKAGALVVVVLSSLVVYGLGLDVSHGVKIVGVIPQGLPDLMFPDLDLALMETLLPSAFLISFIGFIESVSVAKVLASRRRQKITPNQELVGLGAANIGAAISGGYPVTGGFSRSSVNFQAGANTPLAALITAFLVAMTVAFLTPLFHYLPKAVLASIIMVAILTLVDIKGVKRAWNYSREDAFSLISTFVAVLAAGVEIGLAIGVVIAILLHLWRISRPHVAIIGRVQGTEHFRNFQRHEVMRSEEVAAARIDESLMFANAAWFEDWALGLVADNPKIQHLVLNCAAINYIDGSALEVFERLEDELVNAGVTLHLADVKGPVMDRLKKAGFADHLGVERIHLSTHDAMTCLGCPM